MARNSHFQIGLAALALSLFLVLVGIPYGVTSPSNVPKMVLSPVFWPYVLCEFSHLSCMFCKDFGT